MRRQRTGSGSHRIPGATDRSFPRGGPSPISLGSLSPPGKSPSCFPFASGQQLLLPPTSLGTLQSPSLTRGLGSGKLNCEKINIISSRLCGINACNKEH